jgi:hypothetical protein
MNRLSFALSVLCASLIFAFPMNAQSWQSHVTDKLSLMGHRNWILIVDSAYPAQVSPGIETIVTNSDQLEVVGTVLNAIKNSIHVRPIIYMDAELPFVTDQKAPGVTSYRAQLTTVLRDYKVNSRLHQSLIDDVAKDGALYHVLILKTKLAIPYTSVFIHLDCKYWSDENERDLREAMRSHGLQ